jgi:hypothetical protein
MPLKPARVQARRDSKASTSPPNGPEHHIVDGHSRTAQPKAALPDMTVRSDHYGSRVEVFGEGVRLTVTIEAGAQVRV